MVPTKTSSTIPIANGVNAIATSTHFDRSKDIPLQLCNIQRRTTFNTLEIRTNSLLIEYIFQVMKTAMSAILILREFS